MVWAFSISTNIPPASQNRTKSIRSVVPSTVSSRPNAVPAHETKIDAGSVSMMFRRLIAVFVLALLTAVAFAQNVPPKQTETDDLPAGRPAAI